ncbi:MAG: TonB-dependent receptor plug domain-containing protein [Bacteroidetes bacterium]|nr:TonB-dependent receptor plug domain-containing protein [Bacteroidota bacterium]MBU1486126.1 TonB-dependent receptor plug domain-containing protein [Bacteroidota bacterium]MBU2045659.1 TonB-dependent receptor plug domain-containing protein [Bacteroidota bacterium]MBU2269527.1 TonB-dependent receptor plug domain-containing protein [Bacteroidota bacterium]MBU2376208.1 TonB-dependent receptor plug domain-containing protein [Bacteroidota bacterium]
MKAKFYIPLFILIGSWGLFSFVQDEDPLKELIQKFQKYQNTYVQEKVYLHTDKPYYAIGDDIWFKAYVVDAQTLTPTTESNILYVDLINGRDSVKKTLRIPLVAGFGSGNFELKDSLREGNYRLRAYTTWMRNFGEEYFFDRTIKIGNAWTNQVITTTNYQFKKEGNNEDVTATINYKNLEGFPYANKEVSYNVELDFRKLTKGNGITDANGNLTIHFVNDKPFLAKTGRITTSLKITEGTIVNKYIPIQSTSNETNVQFFPEGGDLLNGVKSRVAFKALGADGLGKDIKGFIQDHAGKKIATINPQHLGMGYFSLLPTAGMDYKAIIQFEDGSEKSIPLPKAQTEGAILSVNPNMQDSVFIKVSTNLDYYTKNKDKVFSVIAQNSGNILYTAKSKLAGLNFSTLLDKARFPSGITQFTLFNDAMLPIAERLIFIEPKNTLDLKINLNQKTFSQRSPVKLDINAIAPNGKPIIGSFSMAVVDETKVPIDEDIESTIYSNLLLTSDIKGYVENPNYYLHDINEQKLKDVDVLMMTQGWRRFNWKNIHYNTSPTLTFKPEKTLFVSGKVTQGKDKPVVNGTVTLFSSVGQQMLVQAKTDQNGEFKIDSLFYNDSTKFVIQGRTDKGRKNVDIEIYNQAPQIVTKNINIPDLTVNINESMQAYLKNSKTQYESWLKNGIINRSILLKEVKVVETKPLVENSSNLNGAGSADRVLTEKDLQYAISIDQALQGRVAGLQIIGGIAYIRGREAQIILDGMYVDGGFLSSINPRDVESIEILKSIGYTAIYGSRGGGGVIVINTKRGKTNYNTNNYAPGIVSYNPIGLYKTKEFYVPNYDDPKINNSVLDLRTTIYWNPSIVTDSTGHAQVDFFNADGTGNYKVVLEGMDLNGHLGRKVIRYQVNPAQ